MPADKLVTVAHRTGAFSPVKGMTQLPASLCI